MVILLTTLLTTLLIYFRLNFFPLYRLFGFYQGDIWYFYTFYGDQIKNQIFYNMDYPIGVVLIQKLTAFLSQVFFSTFTYQSFLLANALLIIPAVTTTAWLLYKIAKKIDLNPSSIFFYFVLSPSLYVYSTINYDAFPLFFVCLAIFLILYDHHYYSLVSLSLGAVTKIYPLFLLPIFLLYIYKQSRSFKKVIFSAGLFLGIYLLINLPFFIFNQSFWLYPYLHQLQNPEQNDPTTLSFYLRSFGLRFVDALLIPILMLVTWVLAYKFYKSNLLTDKNFLFFCLLTCFSLVFGNHVYTPQYLLWFLPLVALCKIPHYFVWIILDLVNTSTRFFYFKLKTDFIELFQFFHNFTILFFVYMYILLIKYALWQLRKK